MTVKTIDALLAESPVFATLGEEARAVVAGCAQTARFDDDEYLFRAGTPAERFYVVRRGSVALEIFVPHRGPITIETAGAGEVVGWSWLFAPYRWHFDGRAVGPVHAVSFDGACLRATCDEDPALGYALMRRFAAVMLERLQATRVRLLDVYGDVRA